MHAIYSFPGNPNRLRYAGVHLVPDARLGKGEMFAPSLALNILDQQYALAMNCALLAVEILAVLPVDVGAGRKVVAGCVYMVVPVAHWDIDPVLDFAWLCKDQPYCWAVDTVVSLRWYDTVVAVVDMRFVGVVPLGSAQMEVLVPRWV